MNCNTIRIANFYHLPGSNMQRRHLLQSVLALPIVGLSGEAIANDFGASKGYLSGWPPLNERGGQPMPWTNSDYLVSNMSGGMEPLFKHSVVKAKGPASELRSQPLAFKLDGKTDFANYQRQFGKTAVLVARGSTLYFENYEFSRTADMRFYSKSMAKGVLGLLAGLALEHGVLDSLDDPIEKYDGRLKGKPLGGVKLRHALNMTSGADICQLDCGQRNDFERWEERAFLGSGRRRTVGTDADRVAIDWPWGFSHPSGTRFNYSHVDPHLVGMAIRGGAGQSLAQFTEKALWQPMGAQSDALWLTDSQGSEEVAGSFCATLRDWGRIGLLVANKGSVNGKQVIKESWLQTYRHFKDDEAFLKPGNIPNKWGKEGYKNFLHLPHINSAWLRFGGDLGQSIYIDQKSGTVMVVLSVSNQTGQQIYEDLFKSALVTLGV
jgi:CubicO group peptidase (beta-lactamase class C family)